MPLKILIALAIVNKSPLKQILYPFTSWSCTMVHAWLAFKVSSSANPAGGNATGDCRTHAVSPGVTTLICVRRRSFLKAEPLVSICTKKNKGGGKKIIFTDGTNAAPLRASGITASLSFRHGLCALKCRQESHNCVLLYFLTLQRVPRDTQQKKKKQKGRQSGR